ncbi:hypothetical protein CTheo_6749 [Ceratobasidium theobromae]|uniref:Uncharacterized protein n=1 Tax=Ceratobasidium theobromae TaxID=1582974 RepID=A0A5N5QDQ7_9AGAM|nr:hypothetical protein CTheo_6749 [Ceratobasidium theobromae]
MLRRGARVQHIVLGSFPPRGTRPVPIWNFHQFEPDEEKRGNLKRLIAQVGVEEHDLLRWRNACVSFDIQTAIDILKTPGPNITPLSTPLWVTSHLIRRKVHNATHASIAAHLALVAVPASRPLVSADGAPLLLALGVTIQYSVIHALPLLVARILALPKKHHTELLQALCNPNVAPSSFTGAVLQLVLDDIQLSNSLLPRELWDTVWHKWGRNNPLGDKFTTSLRQYINDQGVHFPYRRNDGSKLYTQGATFFKDRISPTAKLRYKPSHAALTAAAHSKHVSARLFIAMASALVNGLLSRQLTPKPRGIISAHKRKYTPGPAFLATVIHGLIRKKAYPQAVAVWKNVEKRKDRMPITNPLFDAAIYAYLGNGSPRQALRILHTYTRPKMAPSTRLKPTPMTRYYTPTPTTLTAIIAHLPASIQYLVFRRASEQWRVKLDGEALEAVMLGAVKYQVHKGDSLDLTENMRKLAGGLKQLFTRTRKPGSPRITSSQIISSAFLPLRKSLKQSQARVVRQNAIEMFRSVILGNWPFIRGREQGYGTGLLEKSSVNLFVPAPLRRRVIDITTLATPILYPKSPESNSCSSSEFKPSPLHPSPTPGFSNAFPTRRAWTAYLALLDPDDLPEALEWMRSVDGFFHSAVSRRPHSPVISTVRWNESSIVEGDSNPLSPFRPERAALADALVRWEGAMLARETPIERAWEERKQNKRGDSGQDGGTDVEVVGQEGALRVWLIEWLGLNGVPSREEVAKARVEMKPD